MIPMWRFSGRLGNQMFQHAYLLSQEKKGLIQDIYVQDEKYFEDVKDEVRNRYSIGIGAKIPFVSIHVRRTDYVGNPLYVDLFANGYYERAMAMFPKDKFMVFSDSIDWCREQEIFKDCVFSHGDELEDLNIMASCKAHIIANSSFSWWAAWLGGGKVIAPKEWYTLASPNDNEEGIASTRCPDSWIRI